MRVISDMLLVLEGLLGTGIFFRYTHGAPSIYGLLGLAFMAHFVYCLARDEFFKDKKITKKKSNGKQPSKAFR